MDPDPNNKKPWTVVVKHPSEMDEFAKKKLGQMQAQYSKWDSDPKSAEFFKYVYKLFALEIFMYIIALKQSVI